MTLAALPLSCSLAMGAVALAAATGVGLGCAGALLGRRGRAMFERAIELSLTFPSLLIALLIVALFGPGAVGATIAVGVAMAPGFARTSQVLVLSVARSDYVSAARIVGVGPFRRVARYILPNIAEPLLVKTATAAAGALVSISSLSFLGFGVQPPHSDWGRMLTVGLRALYLSPLPALAPGLAITLAGVGFNALGDALSRSIVGSTGGSVALPSASAATTRGAIQAERLQGRGSEVLLEVVGLNATVAGAQGGRPILADVDLSLARGEALGIVGESGSGKTTLALSLAGLTGGGVEVDARSIRFEGAELLALGPRERDRLLGARMGFVFQSAQEAFNPRLSLGRQMREGPMLHVGLSRSAASQRVVETLRRVGVGAPERRVRQRPSSLSGGMLQRCLVAMALLDDPSLLIADEPTTALDVTVQAQVLELLIRLRQERDTAIVLVSHDLTVVARLCNRVAVMYAGRIVETGPIELISERRAVHPYTRLLLDSVLRHDVEPSASMAGPTATQTAAAGPGCPFRPRCAMARARCGEAPPRLRTYAQSAAWRVACWAVEEADTFEPA
jgi:peptide/nickel transport system permease protein